MLVSKLRLGGLVALIAAGSVCAQVQSQKAPMAMKMSQKQGESVVVDLGMGYTLNRGSTLQRQLYTIVDPTAPIQLDGDAEVAVKYFPSTRTSSGEYRYIGMFAVFPGEAITALEIRSQIFDFFGRHQRTLSTTKVFDITSKHQLQSEWRIFSENEASEAFTAVTYIAQARTSSGRVYVADPKAVFTLIRQVSSRITEAELEPMKQKP